jgi:hypothetical protein
LIVIPTSLLTELSGVGVAGHIGTGGGVDSIWFAQQSRLLAHA